MKRNTSDWNSPTLPNYFLVTKRDKFESETDFYNQHLPETQKSSNKTAQTIFPAQPISESKQPANLQQEFDSLKCKFEELQIDYTKVVEENKKYKKDLTELRKIHNATCRGFVKKDMKIKLLQKKFEDGLLYDRFKEQLGDNVLKALRKLSGNKRSDSSFILHCLRKLYTNPADLKSKSAAGTDGKDMLSPDKRDMIESIFLERLQTEQMQDSDIEERFVCLNKLINDGIYNITRPKVCLNSLKFFLEKH